MREQRIDPERLPRHVAIIMDGNGRWAEARGLERKEGHRAALDTVREVIRAAHELGVSYLTLYAFSLENWNRPKDEVIELMRLLEEILRNGIRLRVVGRLDRLLPRLRSKVEAAVERSANNTEMTLCIALSYGGRAEIVDAARGLMRPVSDGVAIAASSAAQAVFSADISARRVSSRAGAGFDASSRASSASAASPASPRIPSAIGFTSPSIRASVSTWMTWAPVGQ